MINFVKKNYALLLTVCVIAFCVWWWWFLCNHEGAIIKIPVSEYAIKTEEDGYPWYLDEVSLTNEYIEISGWLYKKGTDIRKVDISVVLKSKNSGEYYKLSTGREIRPDVTKCYHDGCNYNKSGFIVKISTKGQYHLEDGEYEIFLLYKVNDDAPCLINTQRSCVKANK